MKLPVRNLFLSFLFLFFMNLNGFGQAPCDPGNCNLPGQKCCGNICRPASQCAPGKNPPPPGLVVLIDTNIQFLLAAGLCLGICFFGFQKKGASSFQASEN
ncbi:MAG: hypothetical protein R6W85_09155, partial [Gillisia sp.]